MKKKAFVCAVFQSLCDLLFHSQDQDHTQISENEKFCRKRYCNYRFREM